MAQSILTPLELVNAQSKDKNYFLTVTLLLWTPKTPQAFERKNSLSVLTIWRTVLFLRL